MDVPPSDPQTNLKPPECAVTNEVGSGASPAEPPPVDAAPPGLSKTALKRLRKREQAAIARREARKVKKERQRAERAAAKRPVADACVEGGAPKPPKGTWSHVPV